MMRWVLLQSFAKVVDLNPNDGSAWLNLGAIDHLLGNLEEAKDHYKMAHKFSASQSLAKQNLEKVERLLSKQRSKGT
jgi:Flp pilus assembly protein TadD